MNEKVVVVPGFLRVHLIPKIASASIYAAFKNEKRHHLTTTDENAGEYRFFPVRHPLDRLVSLWMYFCHGAGLNGQPQVAKLGYFKGQSLESFIEVASERHWENIHTRMQVEFTGPHKADRYARYENLAEEWAQLMQRFSGLRVRRDLPVIHKTEHMPWANYYSADLKTKAELAFTPDMELYERQHSNG